jgi:hypothetical protein
MSSGIRGSPEVFIHFGMGHKLLVKLYKGLGLWLGTFPDDMDG